MFFVCHPKSLHKHCFQFLLGVKMAPRETENNAYAKFWAYKQRALWYVMVFSGVVNYCDDRYRLLHCIISFLLYGTLLPWCRRGNWHLILLMQDKEKGSSSSVKMISAYFHNFHDLCCRSRDSLLVLSITENFPS